MIAPGSRQSGASTQTAHIRQTGWTAKEGSARTIYMEPSFEKGSELELTMSAAENGDISAQFALGDALFSLGEKWLRTAAMRGHEQAQATLNMAEGVDGDALVRANTVMLSGIVGNISMTRAELNRRVWDYVLRNDLCPSDSPNEIVVDQRLIAVALGKFRLHVAEMHKFIDVQVTIEGHD